MSFSDVPRECVTLFLTALAILNYVSSCLVLSSGPFRHRNPRLVVVYLQNLPPLVHELNRLLSPRGV